MANEIETQEVELPPERYLQEACFGLIRVIETLLGKKDSIPASAEWLRVEVLRRIKDGWSTDDIEGWLTDV